MTTSDTRTQTTFMYRLLRLMILPNILIYLWSMADYLTHPLDTGFYDTPITASPLARALFAFVLSPVLIVIGILIMRRVRGNVIGVQVTLFGLFSAASRLSSHPPALLLSICALFNYLNYSWLALLFIFFPDGRAYPRWTERWLNAAMLFVCGYSIIAVLSQPDLAMIFGITVPAPNVLFIPSLRSLNSLVAPISVIVNFSTLPLVFLSPILRFRASAPGSRERQQIKWLGLCAAGVAALNGWYVVITVNGYAVGDLMTPFLDVASFLVFNVFPPLTLGLVILRHKLYDIDIIIRRTLIYSILTASLAAIYFGGVVLAQTILRALTGQSSDIALVISTLAIAALFNPLRHRIQSTIDRRFFRRKYNAERTLEAFSLAVRDEVDLDTLQAALVGVVQETMGPQKIGLWLRENDNSLASDHLP